MLQPIQRLDSGTSKSIQSSLIYPTLSSIVLELVNRSLHAKPKSRIDVHVHLFPEWQVTCQDDATGHEAGSSLEYLSFIGILDIQVGRHKHIQKGNDIIYSGEMNQSLGHHSLNLSSISIRDFYRNIPVRRRALSDPGTLRSELERCRKALAVLVVPHHSILVTLKVKTVDQAGDRVTLLAQKTSSLLTRYQELFSIGVTSASFALPIATVERAKNASIDVRGFLVVSLLSSRFHQHILLNGRLGDAADYQSSSTSVSQFDNLHNMVLQILQASYIGKGKSDSSEFLPSGRHFGYFLDIHISHEERTDRRQVETALKKILVDVLQTHHLLPLDRSNSASRPATHTQDESPTKKVKGNGMIPWNRSIEGHDRCFSLDRSGLLREPIKGKEQDSQSGWLQNILSSWRRSLPSISPSEIQISTAQDFPNGQSLLKVGENVQTLEKAGLKRSRIVGQADAKFISILYQEETIVLIDQHAAHERVRLEGVLTQYTNECFEGKSARFFTVQFSLPTHLSIPFEDADVRSDLAFWGFHIECKTEKGMNSRVQIKAVPAVLYEKLSNRQVLASFIAELASSLEDSNICRRLKFSQGESISGTTKDNIWLLALRHLPDPILDAFNSLACRGAIMFNDPLTFPQCEKLLTQLSQTTFPFQCAHARPSLAPICSVGSDMSAPIPTPIRWESLL